MIIHGDVAFMILATTLVLIMTPGLAFFYGGLVERKNALTIMFQVFISIGIVGLLWIIGGFSLVFGDDIAGIIGNPLEFFALRNVVFTVDLRYSETIPFILFFMYQMMFAIITAPLMTGAYANRLTVSGWIKILIVWMILIYFPVAHWVWGGGFLSKLGFVDFAGGAVIHITSGFGCLGGIYVLGERKVKNEKGPFNLGLVAIGAGLLLFGWYGFNAGSALAANGLAAHAFMTTCVSAAAALVSWMLIEVFSEGKTTLVGASTGLVIGLVAITPGAGFVPMWAAVICGL